MMILWAIASSTIGRWLRHGILALAQQAEHDRRNPRPEYYKFPIF
jgi:hypothetical protein